MNATPTPPTADFSPLSRIYRALEFLAFGGDLERTRFAHLGALRDCTSVLILGEGDGRCLSRLLALAPHARVRCVDASPGMVTAATQRVGAAVSRVTFITGDARTADLGDEPFDAVVTLFFLDCFSSDDVERIVARVTPHLTPGARWLFGDFVLPPRGWRRIRAKLWLAVLYRFFGMATALNVRVLPESEAILERAGFAREATQAFQHGMLRTSIYRR